MDVLIVFSASGDVIAIFQNLINYLLSGHKLSIKFRI